MCTHIYLSLYRSFSLSLLQIFPSHSSFFLSVSPTYLLSFSEDPERKVVVAASENPSTPASIVSSVGFIPPKISVVEGALYGKHNCCSCIHRSASRVKAISCLAYRRYQHAMGTDKNTKIQRDVERNRLRERQTPDRQTDS